MDIILSNVWLIAKIRESIIGVISNKIAEAIVKSLSRENIAQRQEIVQFAEAIIKSVIQKNIAQRQKIVKSYQTTQMKHNTFISEMLRYHASVDQIVNVLVEEGCDLLEGGLVFEAQINQAAVIWGERSVRTSILSNKEARKKLKCFKENNPSTLDVPRNCFEEHSLVVVNQNGEHKVYTTATNFPEVHQYEHSICGSIKKHWCDHANSQAEWASISEAQMRWMYRNRRYRQKQQAKQIENSKNHVKEEPKNERQLQDIQAEPAIPLYASISTAQMRRIYRNKYRQEQQYIQAEPANPLTKYDAHGRNFPFGPIGIGVVVWLFTFGSIWWLNRDTRKEKKS